MKQNVSEKLAKVIDKMEKTASEDEKIIPLTADDMMFLSEIYRRAPGQEKNLDAARKWLMKAVENNDCAAMEMLALDYLNGNELYDKDKKTAIYWFEKAAAQGSPVSQVFLGLAHLLEIGVPYEPITAMFWLKKAEERGSHDAKEVLNTFFRNDEDNITEKNWKNLIEDIKHFYFKE